MYLSSRILGRDTVRALTDRGTVPLLTIGRDTFTRADLASVGCFNFTAAARLSHSLVGVAPTIQALFDTVVPASVLVPHIGAVALAVLGAAFELRGLGGESPLEAWYTKHRAPEARRAFVTVATIKHTYQREQAREARTRRQRRHARRDTAHRLRVDRHLTRQGGRHATRPTRSR